ncbi:MAG: DUF6125 family protein, partial [Armatimonadota bacterium]
RAYQAVDGLWFMMVEQADGFPKALQLDEQVWQVLAKIEAREDRELLGCTGNDPAIWHAASASNSEPMGTPLSVR